MAADALRLLYRRVLLQDPQYRAQVLHLEEGVLDADMWETISMHFGCRCVSGAAWCCRGVGAWNCPLSWVDV
jgi:hypothetical protein